MAGYRGHIAGGIITGCFLLYFVSKNVAFTYICAGECILASVVGALFPDVDIKSKGQNYFYKGMIIMLLCLMVQGYYVESAVASLISFVPLTVRHRGILHTIWFQSLAVFGGWMILKMSFCVSSVFMQWHMLFFFMGTISHLVLDFGLMGLMRSRSRFKRR